MTKPIRIIPVMDVMGGVVVRAVAGRRDQYRPLVSGICNSTEPGDVVNALLSRFGCSECYLADLDAIRGQAPNWALYERVQALGVRLWLDAGVRTVEDARHLAAGGVAIVVVGLETIQGPHALGQIVQTVGADRAAFSLDLMDGRPLGETAKWQDGSPEGIAAEAIAGGVSRLIVLDLARVGVGQGVGTDALLTRLAVRFPTVELIAGGGIRSAADLERLQACGASAALVASALHDGAITFPHLPFSSPTGRE